MITLTILGVLIAWWILGLIVSNWISRILFPFPSIKNDGIHYAVTAIFIWPVLLIVILNDYLGSRLYTFAKKFFIKIFLFGIKFKND